MRCAPKNFAPAEHAGEKEVTPTRHENATVEKQLVQTELMKKTDIMEIKLPKEKDNRAAPGASRVQMIKDRGKGNIGQEDFDIPTVKDGAVKLQINKREPNYSHEKPGFFSRSN